jgi:trans-AT polyketide synthase/acyltransferase/oxidoreductase domain-containing protein
MPSELSPIGHWVAAGSAPAFDPAAIADHVRDVRRPLHVVRAHDGAIGVGRAGDVVAKGNGKPALALLATLPAIYPEWLGDRAFGEAHGVRFPYVAGAMANGIATAELVVAMAKAGMLAFFGAAGLLPDRIARALDTIEAAIGSSGAAWGANLISSPNEPALEEAVCSLYLSRGVARIEASAYVDLTPSVVRFAVSGLESLPDGTVRRARHVIAKVSRPEVAKRFMSPAPRAMLDALVAANKITATERELAARVPIAEDVTIEADSGGHTDNQALPAIFPVMMRLRDALMLEHRYTRTIRVGAAGGLGTPSAVAAALSLGASYVLTGSINQSAIESGLSPEGKKLLADASMGDVVMAPAADMFEQGVKVQVLRRGTMFGARAARLYQLYTSYPSLDAIPGEARQKLEKEILGASTSEVWRSTEAFFSERDPREIERAERDPKHKMALVFRWYLGLSSKWAITGEAARRLDYQIWCGPAMGAFNDWARGSFLSDPSSRTVVQIALNLLEGAAVVTRAHQLRTYGVPVPPSVFDFRPRRLTP